MGKYLSLLLAAVLMFTLAVPTFANNYEDFEIFEPNPSNGRVLIKETFVYDDEEEFFSKQNGTWAGWVYSGCEYEYLDYKNEALIYRERLNGVWKENQESELIYDEHGKIIGLYIYEYDTNGIKSKVGKREFTNWDKDGNIIGYDDFWDNGEGGLYQYAKYEGEFTDGIITYIKKTYYYITGDIQEIRCYYYTHDQDGRMTGFAYLWYNSETAEAPYTSWKEEYKYDDEGRVSKIYFSDYAEGEWVLDEEYYYEIYYSDTDDGFEAITKCIELTGPVARVDSLKETEETEQITAEAKNEVLVPQNVYNINKDVITQNEYGEIVKHEKFGWDDEIGDEGDWKAYETATYEYSEVKKPERSENPIIIDGKYDDETTGEVNPNTGAPVMSVAFATVVCGAALIICKKHK